MASVRTFMCFALVALSTATPLLRSQSGSYARRDNVTSEPYTLPMNDGQPVLRASAITVKRQTFLYGPAVGAGPFSPAGPLGTTLTATDTTEGGAELGEQNVIQQFDTQKANLDRTKYNNLQTLADYEKLYDDEWEKSSFPTGIDPGMLSNYTQDLLFSMERLSFNPYAVRRLNPTKDKLPFTVADDTIRKVSGQTLGQLFSSGRLFYVDHSAQAKLERTDRYAAACDAYFYINSKSGDFLPLAIRTNYGKNLIYTPADAASDWLLAKIMYNINDFFMAQFYHFAGTHFVVEIVYEAAIRTFSDDHPIFAILKRLSYQAFAFRPLALALLIAPGTNIDQYFSFTGRAAAKLASDLYESGYAGSFKKNYFETNLIKRGLLNSTTGPTLKHFPFYEDASVIHKQLRTFMSTFVNSYYTFPALLKQDTELQAWVKEAIPAKIIDFPTEIQDTDTLIDILTHIAFLASASHHTVNLNQLLTGAAVLPFHPTALYKEIPTEKGVQDIAAFLPPVDKCIGMIGLAADFSRPALVGTKRSLVHMFDEPSLLGRMNQATRDAAGRFMAGMRAFSDVVSKRGFGADGLSQGMPFVWKALDPDVIPWSLSI